jgi:hypothetical protein
MTMKRREMKRRIFRFGSAVLVTALACGPLVNAQTPTRIQFAKGRSSTVIKGNTGQFGTTFVLRARSGQKLVIDISPASGVGVKVETEGRFGHGVLLREEKGGRYEVGLEETGDYSIFIGSLGGQPTPFTLTVQVKKLADV